MLLRQGAARAHQCPSSVSLPAHLGHQLRYAPLSFEQLDNTAGLAALPRAFSVLADRGRVGRFLGGTGPLVATAVAGATRDPCGAALARRAAFRVELPAVAGGVWSFSFFGIASSPSAASAAVRTFIT